MKIKEKLKVVTGTTPSKKSKDNFGNYIPFVKPPMLQNSVIWGVIEEGLSKKGARKSRVLPENSILVSCIGNLGKVGLNAYPVAFNQQINAVLPDKDVDSKYLFYYFQSYHFKSQLESIASSTTISIINKSKFGNLEFPYVPLSEQHRIVAKIEELFSELDNGVANLEKTKDQLQTYRQSVLKHAFEGRLTENWRAHNQAHSRHVFTAETGHKAAEQQAVYQQTAQATASNDISQETLENLPGPELLQYIKAERQRQYEQELKEWEQKAKTAKAKGQKKPAKPKKPKEMDPLTEEELQQLPALPEGWCWVKLGNLVNERKEKIDPKELENEENYLALENIQKHEGKITGVQTSNGVKSAKSVFYAKDVLYGKLRPYLNKVVVPDFKGICSTDILVFKPTNGVLSKFVKYRMLNDDLVNYAQRNVSGVQHPRVSVVILNEFKVALPSLEEQKQIVREIESRLSVADNLSESIDQSLQQAQSMRQSILKKAFEGKLVESEEEVEAEKA